MAAATMLGVVMLNVFHVIDVVEVLYRAQAKCRGENNTSTRINTADLQEQTLETQCPTTGSITRKVPKRASGGLKGQRQKKPTATTKEKNFASSSMPNFKSSLPRKKSRMPNFKSSFPRKKADCRERRAAFRERQADCRERQGECRIKRDCRGKPAL
jgi:hypothetical protein